MIRVKKIAIVGNPNSGKSSLFNLLTGLNQRVGNFPGVTVDKKVGESQLNNNERVNFIDLPGTYSLYPKSEDEVVTHNVLFGNMNEGEDLDLIMVVADASNLKRNLLFCTQIIDLKKPVVIVLTMMDIAVRKGISIDLQMLSIGLGVPVVAVDTRKGKGISNLKKQLEICLNSSFIPTQNDFIDNHSLAPGLIDFIKNEKGFHADYVCLHYASTYHSIKNISLEEKKILDTEIEKLNFNKTKVQADETLLRYATIKKIMQTCVVEVSPLQKQIQSENIDKVLLHPIYGNIILVSVFFLIFQCVYWIAKFPMDWIDSGFTAFVNFLDASLPSNFYTNLLIDGVLAGIGGIVIFIPQIMILFGIISLLEDSGYMSRISFLTDNMMRRVGLNGKSVMPLISAVACAVPAIMATRTIENKKQKLITILVTPFMSCSARLPVYTIIISLIIPNNYFLGIISVQGLVLLGMYFLGFFTALFAASVLNFFIKVKDKSIFLMELPVYRVPRWNNALIVMLQKSKTFVIEAGKVILLISIVLWMMSSYGPGSNQLVEKVSLDNSYAGIIGKKIEPVIKPLGYDWKIGIALITSFAAREVFVGTMATLYRVDNDDENTLKETMAKARLSNGALVYSIPTGVSLLVFYAFALQCMSTLAIVKRETGSWKLPILQFLGMGILAYLSSLVVYSLFSSFF
ncbi:MAG TPA: ferrous iron transport protein B [Chitinophagaceae bacterium]|nr:MAG: ferrous iron transport protein B [Bacteroidetes bacterium OLB11]HMN33305.1 ferrous iron transport protein B [Chitinophagaceae bacterium]